MEEIIELDPRRKVRLPKARRPYPNPFTPDEIERLLCATAVSEYPCRDAAILLTVLHTGLRVSELCSLDDQDWQTGRRLGRKRAIGDTLAIWGKGPRERGDEPGPMFLSGKTGEGLTISASSPSHRTVRGDCQRASPPLSQDICDVLRPGTRGKRLRAMCPHGLGASGAGAALRAAGG